MCARRRSRQAARRLSRELHQQKRVRPPSSEKRQAAARAQGAHRPATTRV